MTKSSLTIVGLWAITLAAGTAAADEVRYYKENGTTYRETRRTVRRPVTETRTEERQETVYRDRWVTQTREHCTTVWVPVTEYRVETRLHGWWNPFQAPVVAHYYVPTTRWEPRTRVVRVPVTVRQLVPETRTVRVPVTTLRFAEEQQVTRVAVNSPSPTWKSPRKSAATIARRPAEIGGISRMENDPPRSGMSSGGTIRR